MKKIGCGVVGLGAIGPTHIKCIKAADNAELVAYATASRKKRFLLTGKRMQGIHALMRICWPIPRLISCYLRTQRRFANLGVAGGAGKARARGEAIDVTLEAATGS